MAPLRHFTVRSVAVALASCLASLAAACASQSQPPATASEADAAEPGAAQPPPSEESPAPESAEAPAPGEPKTGAAAEAPAKPEPTFVELCNRMCDRVATRCSESAAESCRMNCTQYEHPPEGCDVQVRTALECAAKAEDLTCVNIAPESCAPDFRRVVACAQGKPEGAMPEDPTKMPDGWQLYESRSGGFAVPMPPGVTEKSEGGKPSYTATFGDSTYEVRIEPPPKDKPTQKNLVRVAMGLVGKCEKKLKLFGMVERGDRVTIRYQSECRDGSEVHGMMSIVPGKMYVLEVRGPKGSTAPKDPFFYRFEVR